MAKPASYTGPKQAKRKPPNGKRTQFKKNNPATGEKDPRINRKGRPRTADMLREYVLDILHEQLENPETREKSTVLRQMLLRMALGGQPGDRAEILNRGFGKVADSIVFSTDEIQKIIEYLPSDMVDRLVKGESLGDVLVAWITSLGNSAAETT